MKKVLIRSFLAMLLLSCKKDRGTGGAVNNCVSLASTFSYKFNGNIIECNGSLVENSREGSLIRKEQKSGAGAATLTNTNYIFSIHATKNYSYSNDGRPLLEIEINTPVLATTTYSHTLNGILSVYTYYPSLSVFCGPDYCNTAPYSGQEFTVTITKISNGYAEGTFSGKLIMSTSIGFADITEGEFKNVRVIQ